MSEVKCDEKETQLGRNESKPQIHSATYEYWNFFVFTGKLRLLEQKN